MSNTSYIDELILSHFCSPVTATTIMYRHRLAEVDVYSACGTKYFAYKQLCTNWEDLAQNQVKFIVPPHPRSSM